MGEVKFKMKPGSDIEPCPKCSNKTDFVAKSMQVCEDCCDIWIECVCGYDPTQNKCGHRLEDVWGSLSKETIADAVGVWNDEILSEIAKPSQP